MDNIVKFDGYLERIVYENNDYKILAFNVDKDRYPNIKINKYKNVSIVGEIPKIEHDVRYKIQAVEEESKYGASYKVMSIMADKPIGFDETYNFLQEILTYNQAKELYKEYPNIVDAIIDNPNIEVDLSKTKGIKEKTFKKIKEKIVDNYIFVDLINEYQGMIKLNIIKKIFEKYKSIEKTRQQINNDPYNCMCSLSGIGFRTADKIILNMENNGYDFGYKIKSSIQRCVSYIKYRISEEENNGHTYIELAKIKSDVYTNIPDCKDVLLESLKNENFVLNKDYMCICNKYTYETEEYIAKKIKEMLSSNVEKYKFDKEKYKKFDNFELSDEQLSLLDIVSENKISILSGYAGTGKTTTLLGLLTLFDDLEVSYKLMSPTGKAAKVMKQSTNREATTIHRGLEYRPPEWMYNEEHKLFVDIVIVDEVSMCDIYLFRHLLEAIDTEKTRLLLIGDSAQLPSVSCGNVLHDLLFSKKIPTISLTKVFRYNEGGLMKAATDVRNCDEYLGDINKKLTTYGSNKDYIFIQSSNNDNIADIIALYKKLLGRYNVEDIQVLTAYKVGKTGTIILNEKLQKVANKGYKDKDSITIGETTYYVDDIIIQNVNNYNAQKSNVDLMSDDPNSFYTLIPNGETGKIISIDNNTITIKFDEETVIYQKGDMSSVSLGYAISIHKSQGSTLPIVILSTPSSQTYMLSSNLLYVGMTRMKEKCFHIGEKATIDKAVHKKDDMNRKTLLQYLISNK